MNTETTPAPSTETSCSPDLEPVKIEKRLIHRIGVREWGMPSICIPGKIWRSEEKATISCMVPHEDPTRVKIETRPLTILTDGFKMSWMPDHWRTALWEYCQAWPSSGMEYGPFLALTEQQRCDFIRERAKMLVESDNIGCRLIAHDIGQFAAVDYQIVEPDSENGALRNGGKA